MNRSEEQIRQAVLGRNPLVYLISPEEERMTGMLETIAHDTLGEDCPVYTWSCIKGLELSGASDETRTPAGALRAILAYSGKGFFVMNDLPDFFGDSAVVRGLREVYQALAGSGDKAVFILSPKLTIPETLEKEVYLIHVDPPDENELLAEVIRLQNDYGSAPLPDETLSEVAIALKGLTFNEVGHIMHRVFTSERTARAEILEQIFIEKEMIVKKSGYLEFVPPRFRIEDMGGLGNLKQWLVQRKKVFSRDAVAAGVPIPKGLLIMGISGCGKSLAAKVVSSLWDVPLFRVDMNLIFSGMYGSPEEAFHHTLKTVESVAPAILWIDEIENGISAGDNSTAVGTHIFSAFLTWMQEKPPLIFIVATANRIQDLPAEIIRKGRFDQVFFVDLPNTKERQEIWRIHLERHGSDPEDFDLEFLGVLSEGWNGAEIEQAVVSARVEAYHDNRGTTMSDVNRVAGGIVPLSKTMEEQMKQIRSWAFGRATPASQYGQRRK